MTETVIDKNLVYADIWEQMFVIFANLFCSRYAQRDYFECQFSYIKKIVLINFMLWLNFFTLIEFNLILFLSKSVCYLQNFAFLR